jgi:DNA gyrase/topoisomerase IV subunit B
MTKNYSAKDVRVLKEVEHIQLNPGMYVGDTSNPVHLIEEALDNALDEALARHANIIAVIIDTKKHIYKVMDDGRGIPIEDDTPIIVSSKLFSGAKFQDKKTAYEISSGLHGVGLVAVNALSIDYKVEVYRNKQHATYKFKHSKLKSKTIKGFRKVAPFSTCIEFKPNKKYFETLTPDIDRIRKRLTIASAEMRDDVQLVLIVDENKEVFRLSIEEHFKQSLLTSDKYIPMKCYSYKKPEDFRAHFAWEETGPITPRIISSVNLLPVDNGGTHLNCFYEMLREFFVTKSKKLGYKFQPQDSLIGLRAYLMLSLKEPKFSSQTKEKLTNRKSDFAYHMRSFKSQLESWFDDKPEEVEALLQKFQNYRKKLDSKKLVTNGTGGRRASTKFTKLRDCTSRTGELFIVEGDSAGGSIIQSRDPKKHAILPLRGKSIPNVTVKKDILKNKEVAELIKAIGTGVGPHFNINRLRYSKIICAADADADGAHIACLLSMVMAILLPELVKNGQYFIAQTPLFAAVDKKKFTPIWSDDELEKARKTNKNIQRYKGLGEMNPSQLKISLLDEKTRNLIPVSYSENIEDLIKLFSSADEKRKLVGEE